MIRVAALAGLLILAACNRNQAQMTPDADAETRAATAAKTLADIAAAEEASSRPLPAPRPRPIVREEIVDPARAESTTVDTNTTPELVPPPQ